MYAVFSPSRNTVAEAQTKLVLLADAPEAAFPHLKPSMRPPPAPPPP